MYGRWLLAALVAVAAGVTTGTVIAPGSGTGAEGEGAFKGLAARVAARAG